jgi:hypothetical protein
MPASGQVAVPCSSAPERHWEGEATKGGTVSEVYVDAHTGAVTKQEPKHESDSSAVALAPRRLFSQCTLPSGMTTGASAFL